MGLPFRRFSLFRGLVAFWPFVQGFKLIMMTFFAIFLGLFLIISYFGFVFLEIIHRNIKAKSQCLQAKKILGVIFKQPTGHRNVSYGPRLEMIQRIFHVH